MEGPTKSPTRVQPTTRSQMAMTRDIVGNFRRGVSAFPTRWKQSGLGFSGRSSAMMPSVNVAERNDRFEVSADLPGVSEENVEIKLSGDTLTIKGRREDHREEKENGYYVSECQFGSFERSFGVPDGVDRDKIDARFKNGVLTISLPKKPESLKPEKSISIQAN